MDPMIQARERRDHERFAVIDSRFQAEPADAQWSSDTLDLITQVLANEELAQTEVSGLDCRTTLCRLKVTHAHVEAANQFALVFPMEVGDLLPRITYYHQESADGTINTVLYLVRTGNELPTMAQ